MDPAQTGLLAGTSCLLLASATGFGTVAVTAIKTALSWRRSAWEHAAALWGSVPWSTSPLLSQEPCNTSTLAPALIQGMLAVSSSHSQECLQVTPKKEEPMGLHTPHKTATDRTAGEVDGCQSFCQGLVCWRASTGAPSKATWTAWARCTCGRQQHVGPQRGREAVASRCCPMEASSGIRLSEQIFLWRKDLGSRCLQTCSPCELCTGDDFFYFYSCPASKLWSISAASSGVKVLPQRGTANWEHHSVNWLYVWPFGKSSYSSPGATCCLFACTLLSLHSDSTGSMVCEKTAGSWGLWEAFLCSKWESIVFFIFWATYLADWLQNLSLSQHCMEQQWIVLGKAFTMHSLGQDSTVSPRKSGVLRAKSKCICTGSVSVCWEKPSCFRRQGL